MLSWRASSLRKVLAALLSRYFGICRIPSSFEGISARSVVVTQGDSLVLAAILDSFAKRSGLSGAAHAGQLLRTEKQGSGEIDCVYWVSLAEEELLLELFRARPSVQFRTLNIFRARGPVKHTPRYKMSLAAQIGLIIGCRFLIFLFGTPLSSHEHAEVTARQLARRLRIDFYRNVKLVRGVPFQSISNQADLALSGAEFDREVRLIASRSSQSERSVRRLARREFFSMAANPRAPAYWLVAPFCNFLLRRLFSEIRSIGVDRLVQAVKEDTVVLVPMHRSHLDYIVLGTTLYNLNLNTPLVAAGVNLNFWPFGGLIRSLGGYFVKRNARNDRIHALVLRRYVTYLIKCGHLQEFFIEGGRSRSGRMAQPKVGLLSAMLQGYFRGLRRDLLFIPVSITYENVMEDEVFGDENTGKSKAKETLLSLFRARALFRRKYGEVIINYGQPISAKSCAAELAGTNQIQQAEARTVVNKLAGQLVRSIRDQSDLTLTSVAYTALLTAPHYGLTMQQLSQAIHDLARIAKLSCQSMCGASLRLTPSLEHFLQGRTNLLHDLPRSGVVRSAVCLGEPTYYIPGERRYTAEFYKSSVMHLFFAPSLLALSELVHGRVETDALSPFHEIFAYDLQLAPKPIFLESCQALLRGLIASGELVERGTELVFASRRLGVFNPTLVQSNIQTLLWIQIKLAKLRENGAAEGLPYKELLQELLDGFRLAVYRGLFTRTEAASQANLISALESLKNRGIISYDEAGTASRKVTLLDSGERMLKLLLDSDWTIRRWQLQWLSQQQL